MESVFLAFVVILFALAIMDLVVGVSNDAVNFLNSAIGARVASKQTIMIIASLGVFVGAVFSSGMMEVARKGIFVPENFVFFEIMAIFMAVMLTDIILLDLFNTFGLPTSTTVSIVFELLGAAVMISMIKLWKGDLGLAHLGEYINSSKAGMIIFGILLSVVVAFGVGAIVQYLSRIVFSFDINKRMKWVGALWSGLALSTLTYFLLIKGMKGASFIEPETAKWFKENTVLIMSVSFVGWAGIMQVLISVFKVNILKLIVLFGTFSLAMAFAGNDLVNFIGVPIAGLESFNVWVDSGVAAEEFGMGFLGKKVQTSSFLLLGAGLIMVLTLWFSKKAQSVTETTLDLSRQDEGTERFKPNSFARSLVRVAHTIALTISTLVPLGLKKKVEENFEAFEDNDSQPVAFDLVRASVNLTVASMLIAIGTSLKLPLSTTYVTFMVAMGASLADKAWGRDSAVFRISGVVNVIGGWFATAAIAFSVSGVFACLIYFFGAWGVGALLTLAIGLIIRSNLVHRSREKEKEELKVLVADKSDIPYLKVQKDTFTKAGFNLLIAQKAINDAFNGLVNEDMTTLKLAVEDVKTLKSQNEKLKNNLFRYLKRIQEDGSEGSWLYLKVFDQEQDIVQSVDLIVEACYNHISNLHLPLQSNQVEGIKKLSGNVSIFLGKAAQFMQQGPPPPLKEIEQDKDDLVRQVQALLTVQVKGIRNDEFSSRNSLVNLSILIELTDLLETTAELTKLYTAGIPERELVTG